MSGLQELPPVEIREMSQNMILRYNTDGSVDAKITRPKKPRDATTGIVYINGVKYTTTSFEFEQIYPR